MIYLRWLKIAIINFPHYEINFKKKIVVFYKTGHCFHFSNPYGVPKTGIYLLKQERTSVAAAVELSDKDLVNKIRVSPKSRSVVKL